MTLTKYSNDDILQIKTDYLSGKTLDECGKRLGAAKSTVYYLLTTRCPDVRIRKTTPLPQRPPSAPVHYGVGPTRFNVLSDQPLEKELFYVRLEHEDRALPIHVVSYVAGIFDGEGCINFTRSKHSRSLVLRANIVNTNLQVLEYIKSIFGGRIQEQPRAKSNWKIAYRLEFANHHAVRFIEAIEPWLIIKSNQATLAFAWSDLRQGVLGFHDLEASYALIESQLHWLNKKGVNSDKEPMEMALIDEQPHAVN